MDNRNLYLKNPYLNPQKKCDHGKLTFCEECWKQIPPETKIQKSFFICLPINKQEMNKGEK